MSEGTQSSHSRRHRMAGSVSVRLMIREHRAVLPGKAVQQRSTATTATAGGLQPHRPRLGRRRGHRSLSDSASAMHLPGPGVCNRNAASTADPRTRRLVRSSTISGVGLSPSEVPCPPRARKDGKPRSTTVRSGPHDHSKDLVSALIRAMEPTQAPSLPKLRARVRFSSPAPFQTPGQGVRALCGCRPLTLQHGADLGLRIRHRQTRAVGALSLPVLHGAGRAPHVANGRDQTACGYRCLAAGDLVSEREVGGQNPERLVPAQGSHGAEVPAVEGEDRVGVVVRGERRPPQSPSSVALLSRPPQSGCRECRAALTGPVPVPD